MSNFDLPWNKFVGFSLFTLEEDLIFDKVINLKSGFSTVFQIIDTSAKTREELRKSQNITLINEIFRVDYNLFFNIILCCMFKPDTEDKEAAKIIEIIKASLIEQLKDYGAIDKMEPRSQTALIRKLGNLISERAASQIRYDYYPTKKPQQVEAEPVAPEPATPEPVAPEPATPELVATTPTTSESAPPKPIETDKSVQAIHPSESITRQTQATPSAASHSVQDQGKVEGLLEFIGLESGQELAAKTDDTKVEMTQQLLEENKRMAMERVLSSVVKGLSTKTGVCFVFTGDKGQLEIVTHGMTEKHADFVLGILSKYPEVVKQTLDSNFEEKTLDAGDGVVILEETENGMLVSITKNRNEIPAIAKRLKVVKTMIGEFLKASF